jgi:large-conductance mechanosensitive channel
VVDLAVAVAVAVVIGAAFGSIVTALVKDLITLALSWVTTLCEGGALEREPSNADFELEVGASLPISDDQVISPT